MTSPLLPTLNTPLVPETPRRSWAMLPLSVVTVRLPPLKLALSSTSTTWLLLLLPWLDTLGPAVLKAISRPVLLASSSMSRTTFKKAKKGWPFSSFETTVTVREAVAVCPATLLANSKLTVLSPAAADQSWVYLPALSTTCKPMCEANSSAMAGVALEVKVSFSGAPFLPFIVLSKVATVMLVLP